MDFFLQQLANGIMMGSIYVLIAMGLVIILSMMDIVNFAHGQLAMLGAYITILIMNIYGASFFVSIIVGFLALGVIAYAIEKGIIRPTRKKKLPLLIAGIATVGLALVVEEIATMLFGRTSQSVFDPFGANPVSLGIIQLSLIRLLIPFFAAAVIVLLMFFLYRTKIGRALRAVSQDSEASALQGINVDDMLSIGFIISVGLAGVAGVFLAQMRPIDPYMGLIISLKGFAIIIVGGMMSLPGAITAAYLLGIGEVMVTAYVGANWADLFFFAAMVLVLLIRPTGIFGSYAR
jgi:branched-chain amino acid transport system permease protein